MSNPELIGPFAHVEKIQRFDPSVLVQERRLGEEMAFGSAVAPAQKLVALFKKLPVETLSVFPEEQKNAVEMHAKSISQLFSQILEFDLKAGDPEGSRGQLVRQLEGAYQPAFNALYPLIAFAVAQTVDFASLEARGRAAIQTISDEKETVLEQVRNTADQANRVLTEVREAAAEQGVTQMAKYFANQADEHDTTSRRWLVASIISTILVVCYAVFTFFLSTWFQPKTGLEASQLIASKVLVFVVIAYALVQCIRNYSAHRHNSVTNRHRQNALLTYKTLAEAGNSPELRDVVLQHAAAAIYAPNDSGYLKGEERGYGAQGLVALASRGVSSGSTPASQ